MKRYWIVALVMAFMLIGTQFAFAEGNFYIPGSADNIGGLGQDGKSFDKVHINNRIVFEGETSDTYEGMILVSDPGSDLIWTMPATSGTMAITDSLFNTTLEDGKILIGNFSDEAMPYTPSGMWDITNAGVSTGVLADGKIWIGNNVGGGDAVAVTMSGDATITNAGVLTIGANKIGTAEFNVNTVAVVTPATSVGGTATVTTGSTILGYYGVANIHDSAYNGITNVSISGQTLLVIVNGTSGTNAVVHNVVVLEP